MLVICTACYFLYSLICLDEGVTWQNSGLHVPKTLTSISWYLHETLKSPVCINFHRMVFILLFIMQVYCWLKHQLLFSHFEFSSGLRHLYVLDQIAWKLCILDSECRLKIHLSLFLSDCVEELNLQNEFESFNIGCNCVSLVCRCSFLTVILSVDSVPSWTFSLFSATCFRFLIVNFVKLLQFRS